MNNCLEWSQCFEQSCRGYSTNLVETLHPYHTTPQPLVISVLHFHQSIFEKSYGHLKSRGTHLCLASSTLGFLQRPPPCDKRCDSSFGAEQHLILCKNTDIHRISVIHSLTCCWDSDPCFVNCRSHHGGCWRAHTGSLLLAVYPALESLFDMVVVFSVYRESSKLCSLMALPTHIHVNVAQGLVISSSHLTSLSKVALFFFFYNHLNMHNGPFRWCFNVRFSHD